MGQSESRAAGQVPPEGDQEAIDFAIKTAQSYEAPKDPEVDMRSDTVTVPTYQMRVAMALAEVGDDVLGHDPTVALLEAEAATFFGKDASIFVPSGTMANLIAIMVHCEVRGSEIILGDKSHIHIYEQGGCSQVAGVHPRVLPNKEDGTLDLVQVEESVRPLNDHFPVSRLLCLENTHNKCGGRVIPAEYFDRAGALAAKHGMKLHVDGARLMNAAVALGTAPDRIVQAADSVSVCLSKGLGAPVGSVLLGTFEFVQKARRVRKVLGGGMRQAGTIAAAALCALRSGPKNLASDQDHAVVIAKALSDVPGFKVDLASVQSNIVMVDTGTRPADEIEALLKEHGLLVLAVGPHALRLVLHHQVTAAQVDKAVTTFQLVLGSAV